MSVGEESLEERRRRRRAGDPRLSAEGREILRRISRGDLQGEFQTEQNFFQAVIVIDDRLPLKHRCQPETDALAALAWRPCGGPTGRPRVVAEKKFEPAVAAVRTGQASRRR